MNKFSIKEALSFGWQKTKEHFWFFLVTILVFGIISIVINMFVEQDNATSLGAQIVFHLVNALFGLGLINAVLAINDNKEPAAGNFKTDLISFLKFLVTQVIFGIMIFVGILLLVVPGILVIVRFQYAPYILVDKKTGIWESFRESLAITKGSGWSLFLMLIAVLGINVLGALLLGVGLFITIPLTTIAIGFVYRKLVNAELPTVTTVIPPAPSA
jgi:uncharacterized membrane protein